MSEDRPTLDQQVADLVADGRWTDEDAAPVHTFAQFLRESGPPPDRNAEPGRGYPPGHPLHDPAARRAHYARWGPYLRGEADGPIDPAPVSEET